MFAFQIHMNPMKAEILNFFKSDRTFSSGRALFMKHGRITSLVKMLNLNPESEELKSHLFEQLRVLGDIKPDDFAILMKTPVKQPSKSEKLDSPLEVPALPMEQEDPEVLPVPPVEEIQVPEPLEEVIAPIAPMENPAPENPLPSQEQTPVAVAPAKSAKDLQGMSQKLKSKGK
jgi:hypothetical protein